MFWAVISTWENIDDGAASIGSVQAREEARLGGGLQLGVMVRCSRSIAAEYMYIVRHGGVFGFQCQVGEHDALADRPEKIRSELGLEVRIQICGGGGGGG